MNTELISAATDNNILDIDIMGSWMEIGMAITAMAVGVFMTLPVIRGFMKKKRNKLFAPNSPNYRNLHSRVHEYLTELRTKIRSDRSLLLQFHNGGEFLDGTSMKKFSLTHESCVVGTSETGMTRQNVQTSTFIELLDLLAKDNSQVRLTGDLPDCHFKRHLEANHTLFYSIYPIKDARKVLVIGCLMCEWCNWDDIEKIDDDEVVKEIPEYSRYIESQLAMGR
jgi:hypothetical protein